MKNTDNLDLPLILIAYIYKHGISDYIKLNDIGLNRLLYCIEKLCDIPLNVEYVMTKHGPYSVEVSNAINIADSERIISPRSWNDTWFYRYSMPQAAYISDVFDDNMLQRVIDFLYELVHGQKVNTALKFKFVKDPLAQYELVKILSFIIHHYMIESEKSSENVDQVAFKNKVVKTVLENYVQEYQVFKNNRHSYLSKYIVRPLYEVVKLFMEDKIVKTK